MEIQKTKMGYTKLVFTSKRELYEYLKGKEEAELYFQQEQKKYDYLFKKLEMGKITNEELSTAIFIPLFTHYHSDGHGHGHIEFVTGEYDFEIVKNEEMPKEESSN